jgi:hypothetical protein
MELTKMNMLVGKAGDKIRNIKNLKINSISLYYLALVIYLVSAFLKTSMITPDYFSLNYCAYFSMAILLFKLIFFTKYNLKFLLFSLFILFFFGLSWVKSSSPLAFYLGMFIVTAYDIDFQDIVRCYLIVGIVTLFVIILLSEVHVIKNLIYIRGTKTRQSFGILYPTDFASHVFYLILAYVYLYYDRMKKIQNTIIVIIAVLIYWFTDARLDSVLIMLIVPVIYICNLDKYKKATQNKVFFVDWLWISTGIFAYLAIFATLFFKDRGVFAFFNRLISSRISLSHEGFMTYGVSIFGQRIKEHGWGGNSGFKNFNAGGGIHQYFMLDSSFVRLLLIYGVVVFICLLVMVSVLAFRETYKRNYVFVGILFLVSLSCLIDQHMLEIAYNPFYIALSSLIVSVNQNKQKKVGNQIE